MAVRRIDMKTKNKRIDKKAFYIVSSLSRDESWSQLGHRKMYETENEAKSVASNLIKDRAIQGKKDLSFFILKAVCRVGYATPPVTSTRLR